MAVLPTAREAVVVDLARLPLYPMTANLARFAPLFLAGMVAYLYRDRVDLGSRRLALAAFAGLAAASQVPHALTTGHPPCLS